MPQSTTTSVPTSSFTIKASYAGDIRRFTLCNISFQDLIAQLIEIFKFPTTVEIDIKYQDEEGDFIRVTSNKELAVAFQIANPLRISLTTTESLGVTPNIPATAATISPSVLSQDRLEDPITESTNVAAAVAEDPLLSICQAATAPCKGDIKKPKMTKEDRKKLQQQRKEDKKLAKQSAPQTKLLAAVVEGNKGKPLCALPGTEVSHKWKVQNTGMASWPANITLLKKQDKIFMSKDVSVLNSEVLPGSEVEFQATVIAPKEEGQYVFSWNLATSEGKKFGTVLKFRLVVTNLESETKNAAQVVGNKGNNKKRAPRTEASNKLASVTEESVDSHLLVLSCLGFTNEELNRRLLSRCKGDLQKVVCKLERQQNKQKINSQ